MKKLYERCWAGPKKVPVLLIIRSAEGKLRYMNATKAIQAAKKKSPGKAVTLHEGSGAEVARRAGEVTRAAAVGSEFRL